jgi:hypothetical protein
MMRIDTDPDSIYNAFYLQISVLFLEKYVILPVLIPILACFNRWEFLR